MTLLNLITPLGVVTFMGGVGIFMACRCLETQPRLQRLAWSMFIVGFVAACLGAFGRAAAD